jgi:hypothetical protein
VTFAAGKTKQQFLQRHETTGVYMITSFYVAKCSPSDDPKRKRIQIAG